MKIKEYMQRVDGCQDRYVLETGSSKEIPELTAKCGIYENFTVALQTKDFEKWLDILNEKYELESFSPDYGYVFWYTKTGRFGTLDSKRGGLIESLTFRELKGTLRQYDTHMLINTGHNGELGNSEDKKRRFLKCTRDIANLILEILDISTKNKFPLWLPRSVGWNHKGDNSKMVFYKPEEERK